VERGFCCKFFTYVLPSHPFFPSTNGGWREGWKEGGSRLTIASSYGCPPNVTPKLEFGRPDVRMVFGNMGPDWDLKIHSVYCAPIA
jgi:hypothetical protein